jgi:hypothetical protein
MSISEEQAHRLLARAVALDSQHRDAVSLADLRSAAIEAGIDASAFDRAASEVMPVVETTSTRLSRWAPLVSNLKAAFAFWVVLTILARLGRLVSTEWAVASIRDVLACGIGVGFAFRFQARVVQLALTGIGVSVLSLLVVNLLFGIQSTQGGGSRFAAIGAGVLGSLAWAALVTLERRRIASGSGTSALTSRAPTAAEISSESDSRRTDPLRLVRVALA